MYFTAVDLMSVARSLDEQERQMMLEMGTDTPEFLRYMAEDSGNVADDGNYSIQVIQSLKCCHSHSQLYMCVCVCVGELQRC
jgi:hypothetical protein